MLILGVISRLISLPPLPEATAPGPFRFAAAGELESVVRAGGFEHPTIERQVMTFEFESVDEYAQVVIEVTGWRRRVDALSAGDLARFRAALTGTIEPLLENGRVHLQPGHRAWRDRRAP
jgi:hypothetical protein